MEYSNHTNMSKQVTVEEGSASPPPGPGSEESTPDVPVSTSTPGASGSEQAGDAATGDVVDSGGANSDDGEDHNQDASEVKDGDAQEEEEWDPSEERLPGQTSSTKGKGKAVDAEADSQPWQAVWAAEQNG